MRCLTWSISAPDSSCYPVAGGVRSIGGGNTADDEVNVDQGFAHLKFPRMVARFSLDGSLPFIHRPPNWIGRRNRLYLRCS